MFLDEQTDGFGKPGIGTVRRVARQVGDDRLNFLGRAEFGQLHQGRQLGDRIRIAHDTGAEEQPLGVIIGAERARGVATDGRVFASKVA